jgi:hypothetical protein
MRIPWHRTKVAQLDLPDFEPESNVPHQPSDAGPRSAAVPHASVAIPATSPKADSQHGRPMLVAVSLLLRSAS